MFQAYLQCATWYLDLSMKQQVAELSVKTEDPLANAPVTLEDSQLCPGKILNGHTTKHNSGNCVLNILSKHRKTTFSVQLGTDTQNTLKYGVWIEI